MKTATCKNVRRELEEAAVGELLSSTAKEHLRTCNACATVHDEDTRLRNIMANLGTVEAPGDFDFRLRARLASEKPSPAKLSFGGFSFGLRSAAVASLLLMFGAVLFLSLRPETTPHIAEVTPAAVENPQVADITEPSAQVKNVVDNSTASNPPTQKRVKPQVVATTGRSSRDLASRQARVLRPSDLNARADYRIDDARKPMKVSLDDGNGTSRTISLPAVSFGSQRMLSQNSSPLMASARGSW